MAANINRVVLVGNLTKDPELRHTPAARPSAASASRSTAAGATSRAMGRQANYFDVSVFGNQAESCAQYLSKGARSRSTAGSTGASGSEGRLGQARGRGDHRRDRPVPRQPRRRRGRRAAATSSCRRARPRRAPTSRRDRRRHPVLGESWPERKPSNSARRPGGPAGRSGGATASSARSKSPRSTTRRHPAPALHLGAGQDPQPPHHGRMPAPPGAGRAGREARPRDGAPAVRGGGRGGPQRRRRRAIAATAGTGDR